MSLVFIRIDKIGDLVSTLSVDQHSGLKNEEIHWVIAKGLEGILANSEPKRKYFSINNSKESYSELLNFLKLKKPRAAVVFYAPWWASLACFRAGIPLRVGRASQWHSFLFFNRRLRQTRSRSEMHEHEYNEQLLEFGLGLPHEKTPALKMTPVENKALLQKHGISKEQYFVVHPGMFGSALNWPQEKYNELIAKLVVEKCVVITGTKNDERFLGEIKSKWKDHENIRFLQGSLDFNELLAIISSAKAVVAPSTGVLHLAASLGKKSVGIYSPILAHHPRRWGPKGPNTNILLPQVNCPATGDCLENRCLHFPCMNSISVELVLEKLKGPSDV